MTEQVERGSINRMFREMRRGILSEDGKRLILKRYGEKDLILFTDDIALLCCGFYHYVKVYERREA